MSFTTASTTAMVPFNSRSHHPRGEFDDPDKEQVSQPLDLITLQEEIMTNIMIEIEVKLTEGEQARNWTKTKDKPFDLTYWQKWRLIYWYHNKGTPEGSEMARALAKELIEMDPTRPDGYAQLGWGHLTDILQGKSQSLSESLKQAEEYAIKTLELDEFSAKGIEVSGWVYLFTRQYDLAVAEFEKWIALEPNGAEAHSALGKAFLYAGKKRRQSGKWR